MRTDPCLSRLDKHVLVPLLDFRFNSPVQISVSFFLKKKKEKNHHLESEPLDLQWLKWDKQGICSLVNIQGRNTRKVKRYIAASHLNVRPTNSSQELPLAQWFFMQYYHITQFLKQILQLVHTKSPIVQWFLVPLLVYCFKTT